MQICVLIARSQEVERHCRKTTITLVIGLLTGSVVAEHRCAVLCYILDLVICVSDWDMWVDRRPIRRLVFF